ncbi:MAG: GNAT family N-acetyltransferase [Defluviitaleaceae bacterium]|nr:GNAT family N-acetyltransferase [Defluviitaleaceae bacterium]
MIEIRLAQVSDAPKLKRLTHIFNEGDSNTIEGISESLASNTMEIVCVANDKEKLVGFCCGQIQASMCYQYSYAVITELYVTDECRRQGIGRRLLIATESEFNKRGVTHFHIATGDDNTAALALYQSCGYEGTSVMLEKDMKANADKALVVPVKSAASLMPHICR